MSSTPFLLPRQTPVNGSGRPYPSSTITVYRAGTTTLATIYSDSARAVPLQNPLTSDSAGKFPPVYLDPSYNVRVIHKTSSGVTLSDDDDIGTSSEITTQAVGQALYPTTAAETAAGVTPVNFAIPPGTVTRYGANTSPGTTDMTAAIQAAINSNKKVIFPLGAYKTGPLTLQSWTHLVGETMPLGVGSGDGPVRLLFNLSSGVGITCSDNPIIENITFKNTASSYNETTAVLSGSTAIAIQTNGNALISNCNFYYWYECINLAGSCYYFKSNNVEFVRSTYGYRATTVAPYNVQIIAPISRLTDTFFSGTATYLPRNVKVFGGSIEGYSKVASYFLDIAFFGTYLETQSPRSAVVAIEPGANGASVSLFGCLIYMDLTTRFVNMSGLTGAMLTGSGNIFDGEGIASSYCYYLPSTGAVSLSGDRFGSGHNNSTLYVDSIANAAKFNSVHMPILPSGNTQAAYSGVLILGSKGYLTAALTAAPSSPQTGLTVFADGSSWDPLSRAAGRPYWVLWQGDRWRSPDGE